MENNKVIQQNSSQGFKQNTGATGSTAHNPQGSIGSAGSQGTQAFNNGNEGKSGNNRGNEESGAFDTGNEDGYEGGKLGTAGSGGMQIPASGSSLENAGSVNETSGLENQSNTDKPKVRVPIERDDYEGGNMGTAGSGGMDVHGSESSLSVNALTEHEGEGSSENTGSKNPHGLGSPPAPNIADGGSGGAKQPKEHTGKDTEMGGSTGGTAGLGNGNNEGEGVGNKDGSESGSGGGGSSTGS